MATAAWGGSFVVIKSAVSVVPVANFLAIRFVVAAAALLACRPRAAFRLRPGLQARSLCLGAVYGVAQLLQTSGLARTPASVAGFVTGMYVVFTPLLAAVVLRRRVAGSAWLAVAVSAGGLAVLSLRGWSLDGGELLILASAVLYALQILGLGAWSSPDDAYGMATVQMLGIAAVSVLAAFLLPHALSGSLPAARMSWTSMLASASMWWRILYAALVAGAGALVVQTWAQAHLPPVRAAVTMALEPVFAAVFAVGLGGEHLHWRLLGGVGILAGMLLAERPPSRPNATPPGVARQGASPPRVTPE